MAKLRAYKDLTVQQLRSFCETARTKSFKAAASALGLAHPTVWEQVHSLERHLGTKLVEPHGRGCRLTDDGRELVRMIGPLITNLDSLKRSFRESRGLAAPRLTVAASPRTLVEDLPDTIRAFERSQPTVQVCLREVGAMQVAEAVESQTADVGLTVDAGAEPRRSWLTFEPCYPLDLILLTRRDHPLARRTRILPAHLKEFPLVNGAGTIPDPAIQAALNKLGLFDAQPRRVEAQTNDVIRRYVELGFGIGLITGQLGSRANRGLHERSLSRHFGQFTVNLVSRTGDRHPFLESFAKTLREQTG